MIWSSVVAKEASFFVAHSNRRAPTVEDFDRAGVKNSETCKIYKKIAMYHLIQVPYVLLLHYLSDCVPRV